MQVFPNSYLFTFPKPLNPPSPPFHFHCRPPPLLFRKPPPSTVAKSFSSEEFPVDETFLQTFGPNSKESEDEARKRNWIERGWAPWDEILTPEAQFARHSLNEGEEVPLSSPESIEAFRMLNPRYRKKKIEEMGLTEEEYLAKQFEIKGEIPEPLETKWAGPLVVRLVPPRDWPPRGWEVDRKELEFIREAHKLQAKRVKLEDIENGVRTETDDVCLDRYKMFLKQYNEWVEANKDLSQSQRFQPRTNMATLADTFLADLDELSDNEAEIPADDDADAADMDEDVDGDLADLENLHYEDLDSVSKLQKTQRYIDIIQKVEEALNKGSDVSFQGVDLADDPEYQLIVECNALSVEIENEIVIIHNFIRDKYRLKFPELESLVHHPIDYARVVKKIGNEMDLTLVDLEGLLPSAIIMVVSVTASTTTGKPLPEEVLSKTIEACDRALALDSAKKKVLDFVESRMGYIAPNVSTIVGSAVAAKLMGTAGGLSALAKMPACNVQLLGAKKKNLAGFSTATSQFHVGYIEQTEIFQTTPPPLRMRACRLLAAKATLAARVDSIRGDPSGKTGRLLKDEIHKKIEKWQEPPPAKQPKPLPVPDSEPKKKRGGRRLRKMKERYAITDMRKLANRMQFGIPEESSLGDGLGEGYGMLGQAGSGKLRVSAGQSKLAAKVAKKFKEKNYGSSGATSGLTSSLAFTPVQGIELTNPQAHAHQLGSGTQSTYFSETGTFSKIKRT